MGTILMGIGPRVRRAYLILGVKPTRPQTPTPGEITYRLHVESMRAERGREEIAAGSPHWPIVWDKRG